MDYSCYPLGMSLIHDYKTRSIGPEHRTGEKGKGGMATDGYMASNARNLGPGWKLSPCLAVAPGETITLADISDMGEIRHIWMTIFNYNWRLGILRFYWDDCPVPSIECPVGDFFGAAEADKLPNYSSMITSLNPKNSLSSYWQMPFRKHCVITFENKSPKEMLVFYEITYVLCSVPDNAGYLHMQFRRNQCIPYKEPYVIIDGIKGKGQYVGTYMYFEVHGNDWWGEGEFKFFIDGDTEYPTICNTGTEDYFCGGDGFLTQDNSEYVDYCTPYFGFSSTKPGKGMDVMKRFSMYRWHVMDPIYFSSDLKITVQDLGWKNPDRSQGYEARRDDISTVAIWYQDKPAEYMKQLPEDHELIIL